MVDSAGIKTARSAGGDLPWFFLGRADMLDLAVPKKTLRNRQIKMCLFKWVGPQNLIRNSNQLEHTLI